MKSRSSSTLKVIGTIFGLALILIGIAVYAFYYVRPNAFPDWTGTAVAIISGLGFIVTVAGALLSDLYLPIWDRLTSQKTAERLQLSDRAPIRQIRYETLIKRLGQGGVIPWINRGVTASSLLRNHGRVAIIGLMKSGKTREAAELIRVATEDGWISAIYEPTAALDRIDEQLLGVKWLLRLTARNDQCFLWMNSI